MARVTKYVAGQVAISVAGTVANPQVTGLDIVDYDPRTQRTVTGLFVSPQTAGVRARVLARGGINAEMDTTVFSAAAGLLPINIPYDQGLTFHVDIANTTTGTPGPYFVTLRYEVDES